MPHVIFGLVVWVRKFVPFEENSLRNTTIFNSVLKNMNGVIVEIIEDNAFSYSEILVLVFDNWFLEVAIEFENL